METEESRWGRRVFWAAMLGLLLLGGWLRFADLGLKPLHSDEGVNGWYTLRLYWWNVYRYQPSDYHGPFLYYVNLALFWLLMRRIIACNLKHWLLC